MRLEIIKLDDGTYNFAIKHECNCETISEVCALIKEFDNVLPSIKLYLL